MRRLLLIAIPLALAAAFGASRSSGTSGLVSPPGSEHEITVPLSLYVVGQAEDDLGTDLSSGRDEPELVEIASKVGAIWAPAGIVFEPVAVHRVDLPREVVADLMSGDPTSFLDTAGDSFAIAEPGSINGFYIPFAGGANGFATPGAAAFFVADESSVHDERVTSHEIGHILGLRHAIDDPSRLMFGGTNGMNLTDDEISIARSTAAQLPGVDDSTVRGPSGNASDTIRITNVGAPMDGHTPRGFAGMGGGLFAGDDLNPSFPPEDGVQLFLTFDLPDDLTALASARLVTEDMQLSGSPFEDLGELRAESITYSTLGPGLFDLPPDGDPAACERLGEHGLTCDVSVAVISDIAGGTGRAQFRLRFESAADGDGSQDLAMFFRADPNAAESGIFVLELSN